MRRLGPAPSQNVARRDRWGRGGLVLGSTGSTQGPRGIAASAEDGSPQTFFGQMSKSLVGPLAS